MCGGAKIKKREIKMSIANVRIEPLGKENYDTWKIQVQALLTKNNTWKYVNGSYERTEENSAQWVEEDAKAKSDLILAMSPSELKQVKNCDTSKEIWQKLQSIYQSTGPARKAALLKSLILLKLESGGDMRSHVDKFFDIVDKINEVELVKIEELLTILLLYSIPEEYESFRIAIETKDNLIEPEALKIKLLDEYEARNRNKSEASPGALVARKKKDVKKSGQDGNFKFKCYSCGKLGHKAVDCRSKRKATDKESSNSNDTMYAEAANTFSSENKGWCLDSGATSHMCSQKERFESISVEKCPQLKLANGDTTSIEGCGSVPWKASNKFSTNLSNTLYVPDLRENLLSVSKICDHGYNILFKKNKAEIIRAESGKIVFTAIRKMDLYHVEEASEMGHMADSKQNSIKEWHERFGHLNEKDLKDVIKAGNVQGVKANLKENLETCEVCIKGKQSQKPFQMSSSRSTEVLQLVHSDVCGPMRVNSNGGSRYFLTFIDDYSKWCELYTLKNKSEVFEKFKEYKNYVERRTGKKLKTLKSDNGTEYTSKEFNKYLVDAGIKHEYSVEYTPQQNGTAERKNRTLVEMARCMLIQASLPPCYWAEAVNTANYVRNRCPSKSLCGETPFKMWNKRIPTVKHLRIFGQIVYSLDKRSKSKFSPRSREQIFIGYCSDAKAYRLYDPETRKVSKSRDVVFTNKFGKNTSFDEFLEQQGNMDIKYVHVEQEVDDPDEENERLPEEDTVQHGISKRGPGRPRKHYSGKPGRPKLIYNEVVAAPDELCESESEEEEFFEAASLVSENELTADVALKGPNAIEWKEAFKNEYKALQKNGTWEIVNRQEGQKVIDTKWVLRTKYKANGEVDCRKARLVAKGYTQRAGIDYNETFSPVARIGSIRALIAISAELSLDVYQMDFNSAYLNGEIQEDIYVNIPTELSDVLSSKEKQKYGKNKVCKLKKALYGLKQSGRQWYKKLDSKLKEIGLNPITADPCVYLKRSGDGIIIVSLYVDDLIVATNDAKMFASLKSELASNFEMKDLGKLSYCLGIEFNQNKEKRTISMSQPKYIRDVLKQFKMEDCKTTSTPIDTSVKLSEEMCPKTPAEKEEVSKLPYQNLVGALMWLAVSTRPDIAHAVSLLSQYNTNYGQQHWVAAKRVLRYLKGTLNYGLVYRGTGESLAGYADADWASNIDDRRSFTGFAFVMANAAISWECRKQRTVALSSTEAEYMALSDSSKEAVHLRSFLGEVMGELQTTIIFNDNQGAGQLTRNPVFHKRTKHVDIRHHFIKELVEKGEVRINYIPTAEMPADVLTKGLATSKHERCVETLGMQKIA